MLFLLIKIFQSIFAEGGSFSGAGIEKIIAVHMNGMGWFRQGDGCQILSVPSQNVNIPVPVLRQMSAQDENIAPAIKSERLIGCFGGILPEGGL